MVKKILLLSLLSAVIFSGCGKEIPVAESAPSETPIIAIEETVSSTTTPDYIVETYDSLPVQISYGSSYYEISEMFIVERCEDYEYFYDEVVVLNVSTLSDDDYHCFFKDNPSYFGYMNEITPSSVTCSNWIDTVYVEIALTAEGLQSPIENPTLSFDVHYTDSSTSLSNTHIVRLESPLVVTADSISNSDISKMYHGTYTLQMTEDKMERYQLLPQ